MHVPVALGEMAKYTSQIVWRPKKVNTTTLGRSWDANAVQVDND